MEDTFQVDALASTAGDTVTPKLNDNNGTGPLEEESAQTLLTMEPGHGSQIDRDFEALSETTRAEANLYTPHKSLSRSSSSSSLSSSSSSSSSSKSQSKAEELFHLGLRTELPDDTGPVLLVAESNQKLSVLEYETGKITYGDLGARASTTTDEADHSRNENLEVLSSSSLSSESNRKISVLESETGKLTYGDLGARASTTTGEADHFRNENLEVLSSSSLSSESNQKISVVESETGNVTNGDLGAHASTRTSEVDHSRNEKLELLLPSSLPSETLSEDSLEISANATTNSPADGKCSPSLDKDNRLASASNNGNIPDNPEGKHEQSSHELATLTPPLVVSSHSNGPSTTDESATQFPPVQVMERPGASASVTYRIPSHVFARTKSTAPDWSVHSNESLFSIHMGNMSFTNEQLLWLSKSGELEKPGEAPISGTFIDLSSNQPPINQLTDIEPKKSSLNEGSGRNEATATETMKGDTKENKEDETKESPSLAKKVSHLSSLSTHSDGSTQSFAFPVLIGEREKSDSIKVPAEKQKQPSESQPQSSPVISIMPSHKRWLSCFSCCAFCSLGHRVV
ncbi:uncharacterized protein DDB_G0271670-like [Carya illinoinensis]|uniref:Uncharacterized protein n=1 Tax=Carya illinoinensis TaxID=32201 RepID=A0A8T1P3V2_CARIL|nr:uncharacterized protein DDB_G0271670-like [Carya illinoinensis]KAG6635597.1 hypothetical protein CIPAW_11G054000 [Carya illinoinensis]KAG6635598.1 hypothetical protein CIPAW_11G054000 [Carya illinoinensis]